MNSKKIIVLILLLLFCVSALAGEIEFNPSNQKQMNLNIELKTKIYFSGTVKENSSMTIEMLSLNEFDGQKIIYLEEKLIAGNDVIKPSYKIVEGNKYAVFEINNLIDYADNPVLEIVSNANIETTAIVNPVTNDFDLSYGISSNNEFLEESKFIETKSQALQAKAGIAFNAKSELQTIKEIVEWINENIEYDYAYYEVINSAETTYNLRKGVCDEFSNLAAAFLRIKGIPTKYVVGISFDGKQWGNHGWLETFLPSYGWVGVDATYGEALFLDATHITLGKFLDASQASMKIELPESVSVETKNELPVITINSKQGFEKELELTTDFNKEVGLNQEMQIKVKAKNLSAEYKVLPLELIMHADFQLLDEKKTINLFKPNETKEIIWNAVSPKEGRPNSKGIYQFKVVSIDQVHDENIIVYYLQNQITENSNIKIVDVSPFIENSNLKLEILLENTGFKEGIARIIINDLINEEQLIEKLSQKKLTYNIQNIQPGKISIEIQASETKKYEIIIPEKSSEQVQINETTNSTEKQTSDEKKAPDFLTGLMNAISAFFENLLKALSQIGK